jgi:SHS2 domain-containing protein
VYERIEELDHTADVAIRIRGATMRDLLYNAAHGMMEIMVGVLPTDLPFDKRRITLHAREADELLHAWLSELIFIVAAERLVPIAFGIDTVDDRDLDAQVYLTELTDDIARNATEIKAVTWHGLKLDRDGGELVAEVVFDT